MPGIQLAGVSKEFEGGVNALADISLDVADGEMLVLVGPSGSGKSTLLRIIAGLEAATTGTVSIGGREVTEAPPAQRDIAMVFQEYALYPHMTVRKNLAFGIRKLPKEEIVQRVAGAAAMLEIEELLERRPAALSGGQRQRVAMGRAIVREPAAFLMDEPLSNLDAKLRVTMRAELIKLHRRVTTTTVYVTHDQVEAMTLGDRVALMRDGRIEQCGTPRDLFENPANAFVASFLGLPPMNLIELATEGEDVPLGKGSLTLPPAVRSHVRGGRVLIGIRPTSFVLGGTATGPACQFDAEVEIVEDTGTDVHVFFALPGSSPSVPDVIRGADAGALPSGRPDAVECVARLAGSRVPAIGERIALDLPHDQLYFFDAETGATLGAAPAAVGA
jgi:multiple sugar transport system ATP-binding protein